MTKQYVALCSLLCLNALTSQAADDKKTDKEKFQGPWVVTSMVREGKTIDLPKGKEFSFTFKGDKVTLTEPDGNPKDREGSFTIDEKKKEVDISLPKRSDSKTMEALLMIYSLESDTLKLAVSAKGGPTADRPKGFDDKDCATMIFKKMTK